MATTAPVCMASRQASRSSFSMKGSPTWTLGRFCRDSSVNSAEASSDGARAHGENVAQDSADAGGGALERLDVTGMIVRFNLEGRDEAVADVHDTGVFSGALHDQLAARRQALQVHLARFVGTMLAPHHAEDAQLGDVRLAA